MRLRGHRPRGVLGAAGGPEHGNRVRLVLLALVWLIGCWFLYWTVTSSGNPISFGGTQNDFYNQLSDGFLAGHLSLLTVPPKALTALSDPYSYPLNAAFQSGYHDLSLYHGHFYLSWGPIPALVLFIPWRILHVGAIPQSFAIALFSWIGLFGLLATFELLVRRFLAHVATWKVVLGAVALVFSSVLPYLLRRPDVYEVAVSAGFCFLALGLCCCAKVICGGRFRTSWLLAASLFFGLAAGARWDLVVLGGLLAVLAIYRLRSEQNYGVLAWARALVFVLPWVAVIVGLLWYNWARFGSPTQFGSYYQLADFDPQTTPYYQLGYLAPSLYYYVIAPVRWTLAFPFFALPPPPAYPGAVPAAYSPEIIGGIFTTTPICLWLIGGFTSARRKLEPVLFGAMCASVAAAALIIFVISYGIPGGTMRYEVDFASLLVLPAVICWLAFEPSRRALQRASTIIGALALLYGAIVGVAISITGPNDQMATGNPTGYQQLEDLTSPLPTLVTMLKGHAEIVRVINSLAGYPQNLGDYGTYDPTEPEFTANIPPEEIDVVSPTTGQFIVRASFTRTDNAPHRGRITVYLKAGGTTSQFAFRAGEHEVTLPMKRGLNRIYLWVTTSKTLPTGTFPAILNVRGLTVVPAPTH